MNTIREQVQFWRLALKGAGVTDARLNVEVILAHILGVNRSDLLARQDDTLTEAQRELLSDLCTRRQHREPLDYILGHVEFYGREFHVRAGVLVPRPETEGIVENIKQRLPADFAGWGIDVGCGSGCLAVTLALEFPRMNWVACDISRDAIQVARENADKHRVAGRVHFVQSDGLTAIQNAPVLDVAVSNPPYIDRADAETLEPEVIEHEPHVALFASSGGVSVARDFLAGLFERLKPNSPVALEHADGQHDAMVEIARGLGYRNAHSASDFVEIPRFLICEK